MAGFATGLSGLIWLGDRSPAYSQDNLQQLEQQQQQIQQRQEVVEQATERIRKAEQEALGDLTDLQDNLLRTEGELSNSQYRFEVAESYLQGLEKELAQSELVFERQRSATVARLQVLQRQQQLQGWAVLMQSDSIPEFLQQRYYLKKLYERDREQLTSLTHAAAELQEQQSQVEAQKNGIALLRQKQQVQKASLEQKSQQQAVLIERLKQNRAALEVAHEQLQQDSDNLSNLIQQRLAARRQAPIELYDGPFLIPSQGPVSSLFGWRVHPILGTERFHGGIDFAIDYDTPVFATAGGRVLYADWYGGYGNAVIVDHGGGITSLYAHNNELRVSEGQLVQAGEVVALSGSTGLSTGPHLHFEIRQNGEPVDPKIYL